MLESSPEALLGESQEESDEIDVAVVSESGLEIGPMTRIVLADVNGAGGIRRRRIRERVTSLWWPAFARTHRHAVGTDRVS